MKEMKLCKDCKYCVPNEVFTDPSKQLEYSVCFLSELIDLVSGKKSYMYCSTMRGFAAACGRSGDMWRAKEEL